MPSSLAGTTPRVAWPRAAASTPRSRSGRGLPSAKEGSATARGAPASKGLEPRVDEVDQDLARFGPTHHGRCGRGAFVGLGALATGCRRAVGPAAAELRVIRR